MRLASTKQWMRLMLWICFTAWDKERLYVATQWLRRAKWSPEAKIAIGTDQDQSSLLGFIALVQLTGFVKQDLARLLLRSRGRFHGHQVGLDHLMIPRGEQIHDLIPLSLDRGSIPPGCEHEQDRAFAIEDLEEGLWFCRLTYSHQGVRGSVTSAQRSPFAATIDCDGALSISDVDLGKGFCQALRRNRKRGKYDWGQRIAQRQQDWIAREGYVGAEVGC